ncbi:MULTISPECIES: hypothetical protein [unclassified Streptomyces]|nr:hypothetical protein [Streptomyces sp. CB01883]
MSQRPCKSRPFASVRPAAFRPFASVRPGEDLAARPCSLAARP